MGIRSSEYQPRGLVTPTPKMNKDNFSRAVDQDGSRERLPTGDFSKDKNQAHHDKRDRNDEGLFVQRPDASDMPNVNSNKINTPRSGSNDS